MPPTYAMLISGRVPRCHFIVIKASAIYRRHFTSYRRALYFRRHAAIRFGRKSTRSCRQAFTTAHRAHCTADITLHAAHREYATHSHMTLSIYRDAFHDAQGRITEGGRHYAHIFACFSDGARRLFHTPLMAPRGRRALLFRIHERAAYESAARRRPDRIGTPLRRASARERG